MDFLHAFTQGGIVLSAVFLLLIAMSFASWYVIFWKGMSLKKEYKAFETKLVLLSLDFKTLSVQK